MIYKWLGKTGVEVSVIGLGGHEYLSDGRSRGFNENSELAIQPGHIFEGFGQEKRVEVLNLAFEHGINFFDVTIDSEKEALGRNLKASPPPYEIYIQTRPEGMVYTYDEFNQKMARYDLLKAEVQRILKLLQRERLDFLNIAFMQSALDYDPEYLNKISDNIAKLKHEGLIRFACLDTFSGESTYLEGLASDCFDVIYINFNFADDGGRKRVLPLAAKKGLGVITREAFMKGALFQMGEEADITDRNALARAALKWNLSFEEVTLVVTGMDEVNHMKNNLTVLDNLEINAEEQSLIDRVKTAPGYQTYANGKSQAFFD